MSNPYLNMDLSGVLPPNVSYVISCSSRDHLANNIKSSAGIPYSKSSGIVKSLSLYHPEKL